MPSEGSCEGSLGYYLTEPAEQDDHYQGFDLIPLL